MKVWVCTHEYNAHGGQKIALDPFEIEFPVIVSHQMWVLGTKLRSSVKHQPLLSTEAFCRPHIEFYI